jgi:hypothetical protein
MYKDIYSSIIATGIAEIITLPICTIKTVFQTSNNISYIKIIKSIYLNKGIYGFYNASKPAVASQILSTSLKYSFYQKMKQINNNNTFFGNIFNSVTANIFVSLITHPIDVIKINKQLYKDNIKYKIKDYYKGYKFALSKTIAGGIIFMPVYDLINNYFKNPLYAGFLTSVIGTITMHPLDLYKTRCIANNNNVVIRNIFYGLSINLMRIVPHFTIMMTLIDYLKT